MKVSFLLAFFLTLPLLIQPRNALPETEAAYDPLNALEWREVGPRKGGRVTTVTGVVGQPQVYYMGAAGGGVWKTIDGGSSWTNLTDEHFEVGTIGAVAVAPSDDQVLYVGTGESPIRGVTTSHGDGLWKSDDAGKTWTHVGLPDAGQISRIKIHPENPDIAWVAVQGQIWGPNETRGIFKTSDGGETWRHVLKVNPHTGAADLAMAPQAPDVLYAAMWYHGRTPWFIESGGEGGGLYKSSDGGESWDKLSAGLPSLIGKAGIDVAASNPSTVWAIIEAPYDEAGLYLSRDAGLNWARVNARRVLHSRPWYYNHITVDPTDENTVWVLNVPLMKSTDGGETFERVKTPHGDHHDHWINPDDPLNMISGNDGGATVTYDGGETWSSLMNQPTAQMYRAVTDNATPFRIYGGQQDRSTVAIASAGPTGEIDPDDHFWVGGGESAHIAFDPDDPRLVYATSINNTLTEWDRDSRRARSIKPYPEYIYGHNARDLKYRANWNAPVALSPHDPSVIYYGAQVLLKSTDRGLNWTEISPDLTRNEPDKQGLNGGPITPENVGAEYYNTIFYIVESSNEAGTLWVGSDDGLVHITRNGGGDWKNITPPGAPEALVNSIELSPHREGTAWIALAGYKLNDFSPYVFVTHDHGASWARIDQGLPTDTFVRAVREDRLRPGVLYAGTEAGMFVSFNQGQDWRSMKMNLPPVPITDLAVNGRSLVAATQGRGFWVFDNLELVHQMEEDFTGRALHLLQPSNAKLGLRYGSKDYFEGSEMARQLVLRYYLAEDSASPLSIEIRDGSGELVRTYSSEERAFERCLKANEDLRNPLELEYPSAKAGLHKWIWDLRGQPLKCIENARIYAGFDGLPVEPGPYQARVVAGDASETVQFQVLEDDTLAANAAEFRAWRQLMNDVAGLFNNIETTIENVRRVQAALRSRTDDGTQAPPDGTRLQNLEDWEAGVTQLLFDTHEDEDSWPTLIDGQVRYFLDEVQDIGPPVTQGTRTRWRDLQQSWSESSARLQPLLKEAEKALGNATP